MTFEEVLPILKADGTIAREGWPEQGKYVARDPSNPGTFMQRTPDGDFFPWTVRHEDLLAEDWVTL